MSEENKPTRECLRKVLFNMFEDYHDFARIPPGLGERHELVVIAKTYIEQLEAELAAEREKKP